MTGAIQEKKKNICITWGTFSDSCGHASHEKDGCTGQLGGGHAKEKQFIFKILYCDMFCFFLSADSGDDGIFI